MPWVELVEGSVASDGRGLGNRWSPPTVVNLGGGVDSTALLIGLYRKQIQVDAVVFAAVGDFRALGDGAEIEDLAELACSWEMDHPGDEHDETYRHLVELDRWLTEHGMPSITAVTYVHAGDRYGGLYGNCTALRTLPSISFGRKGCSAKHKGEPIDRWVEATFPGEPHERITRMIGYDAGARDMARGKISSCSTFAVAKGNPRFDWQYPLQSWGWNRERCEDVCREALGYVPRKSSCFFCAAKKLPELVALAIENPRLASKAVDIEASADEFLLDSSRGLSGKSSKRRSGKWTELWRHEGLLEVVEKARPSFRQTGAPHGLTDTEYRRRILRLPGEA